MSLYPLSSVCTCCGTSRNQFFFIAFATHTGSRMQFLMSLSFPVSRKRIFEETLVEHWLLEHWLIEPLNKRFHKESNEVYNASNAASQTTQKEIRNFITYEYLIGLSNVERIQLRSVLDGVLNAAVGYDVIQAMSMSGITSRQSNSRRVASLIIHLLPRRSERKKRLLSPTQLLPHPLKFGHYSRNKKKMLQCIPPDRARRFSSFTMHKRMFKCSRTFGALGKLPPRWKSFIRSNHKQNQAPPNLAYRKTNKNLKIHNL